METNQTPETGIEQEREKASATPRKEMYRFGDPAILFPLIGAVLLGVLWTAALNLVGIERDRAEQAARTLTLESAGTYEAQMIRALREIEQTLNLVAYMATLNEPAAVLDDLALRGLLPPDVLFAVTLAGADGQPLASTHPLDTVEPLDMQALSALPGQGALLVGRPRYDEANQQWWLDFTLPLQNAGDLTGGAVTVSADAGYFVSGYEQGSLGERGLLAVVGNDGIFRVRRTGDDIDFGGSADIGSRFTGQDPDAPAVILVEHPWDGEQRYTSVRAIFGFPLMLVLGLSADEQHAPAEARIRIYLWRTVGASVLILALLGVLGYLSTQLHRSRAKALEEQIEHSKQVEYLAFHDSLTGLPNRSLFTKLLHQGILQARRDGSSFGLMFLDLDKFKIINDTLGHDAGDQLLQEVSQRLKTAMRESDVVARLGGDEFVILLPDTGREEQLIEASRKILNVMRKTCVLAGQEIRITVSIGGSIYPRDGEDEETLMKHADIAMYHAKEEGRNNFKFYSEDLNRNSLERMTLEYSLRHAIENKELLLHYQAKRDLATGKITGMEALLRWQHPDLGLIAPMQFIPMAEESGLIVPIGRWVLETACRQSVAWVQKGIRLGMAVNLSAVQFRDDNLLDDIRTVLEETGMDPQMLELEITESMIMHDLARAIEVMHEIKRMGVRIAIDDFGTGYSSLAALKSFPIDTIKIDGSFIGDIEGNLESQGVADAIITMGRTLGLTVIAEGVESEAQMAFLKSRVCNEFQGFYLNVPMPFDEFENLLASQEAGSLSLDH